MPKLEVTENQLRLIQRALDFYSRVGIGQFQSVVEHPTFEKSVYSKTVSGGKQDYEEFHKVKDKALDELTEARNTLCGEPLPKHGSWGIYNHKVDESCREAYDLVQVIRHSFWLADENRSDMTVDSSTTLTTKDSDKIKVEL